MKGYVSKYDPRDYIVRLHTKSWEDAFNVAKDLLDEPPQGHRIKELKFSKPRAGKRISVTITLRWINRRFPAVTLEDVEALLPANVPILEEETALEESPSSRSSSTSIPKSESADAEPRP